MAHRGGAALAPENTLGAFRNAHAAYGAWIEMDGRLSADGELVIIHDHLLERTTSCRGDVAEHTAAELASCDAAARWPEWGPEPVPSARAVLEEGREAGWRILFELKNTPRPPDVDPVGERAADLLADVLAATRFPVERLAAICFLPPALDRLKERLPRLRVGLLSLGPLPGGAAAGPAMSGVRACIERGYEIAGPQSTSPDLPEAVRTAHEHDLTVNTWTVNTGEDIERVAGAGVDLLTTDRPDLARTLLAR